MAKDLLDAYQARLRELLDDADAALRAGLRHPPRRDRRPGRRLLADPRRPLRRGPRRSAAADDAAPRSPRSRAPPPTATPPATGPRARDVSAALEGFTAAPFTAAEAARRAQQLLRFLALVPVEYGRGVSGTKVTLDFEIQEAVAFHDGAAAAFADLEDQLAKRDARAHRRRSGPTWSELGAIVDSRDQDARRRSPRPRTSTAITKRAETRLDGRDARRPGRSRPTSPTTT